MRLKSSYLSRLAHLYLMVALVLPALIPTGYMLAPNPVSNIVEITICSATNHRQAFLNISTGHYQDRDGESLQYVQSEDNQSTDQTGQKKALNEICPFALACSAQLVTDLSRRASMQIPSANFETATSDVPVTTRSTPPMPARGPPILA